MDDSPETKDKQLRGIYYDADTGFSSIQQTYKEANRQNPKITMDYVKKWFEKQKGHQLKAYRGFNSYIADAPLDEVGADLADYSRSKQHNDGYAYIFVAVDYFTKYCVAMPMKTKQADDCVSALEEVIRRLGNFRTLFSDREGGLESDKANVVFNKNGIYHIISSTPSGVAERMVGTLKRMIHTRIEGLNLDRERWIDLLPKVVKQYNESRVHHTIGMTPKQALDPNNKIQVWLNIKNKASFNRKYERIDVGDKVRVAIKKKTFTKGHDPRFSSEVHTVVAKSKLRDGTEVFRINRPTSMKLYYRCEIRLVNKVEDKDTT